MDMRKKMRRGFVWLMDGGEKKNTKMQGGLCGLWIGCQIKMDTEREEEYRGGLWIVD